MNSHHNVTWMQVAFDPLDGSSIVGANFAVGSIFGIWSGNNPVGQSCRQQVAALYAVYGPQTVLVCARPRADAPVHNAESNSSAAPSTSHCVQEFVLTPMGWRLQRDTISIDASSKVRGAAQTDRILLSLFALD